MQPIKSLLNDNPLPLVLSCPGGDFDVFDWAGEEKQNLRELLSEHGAILFRDFPINNVADFERLAEVLTTPDWVEYLEATSPRDPVESKTATSTKYDKDRTIFFHNEKSYSRIWPKNLFFYCDRPADKDGETPLADCRAIYRDLPEHIRANFESRHLMYVRCFSNHMGIPWKKAFNVESRQEMEDYCEHNLIDELSWKSDSTPVLRYRRNTSILHPLTGDPCWFNHGTFFNVHSLEPDIKAFFLASLGQDGLPYNTYYGDGEDIAPEDIDLLRGLYEKHSTSFAWQQRDVLFIDNMLVAHGRRPFQGARSILVTMTEAVDYHDIESF